MLFADIVGHEDIKRKLIQSVKDNRVSHAQLFLGNEGTGKLALAIAYAQYINCTNRGDNDSCGVCPSCRKYNLLSHPDLHFIFPTTTNKSVKKDPESELFMATWRSYVEECGAYADLSSWYKALDVENKQGAINVRDAASISRKLSLKAYEAEYKVVIIWMAEKLNVQAANKLLKLLEEPPEKTLFILVAENYDELLTTVRSRTMLVKMPKLSVDEIRDVLVSMYSCSTKEAHDAAVLSNGNWILATRYITKPEEENPYFAYLQKWMRYCFKFNVPELIDFIANDIKSLGRERQKEFLSYSLNFFHNVLMWNNGLNNNVLLLDDEKKFINNFAPFINQNNIELICGVMEESINQIERNGNASLIFLDDSYMIYNYFKIK